MPPVQETLRFNTAVHQTEQPAPPRTRNQKRRSDGKKTTSGNLELAHIRVVASPPLPASIKGVRKSASRRSHTHGTKKPKNNTRGESKTKKETRRQNS